MNIHSTKTLNNGTKIPVLGLGVFKSHKHTYNAVRYALDAGYRHIDTASIYKNEQDVGKAVRDSGIAREDIFITTKLWNDDMRAGAVKQAFHKSLRLLQTEYVDLYLVHWPVENEYIKAYKIMEEFYTQDKIRALGVSNFQTHHLKALQADTTIKPTINQIEIHPYLTNKGVISYCNSIGIAHQAWSPLARGRVLHDNTLKDIANNYNKTVAQVVIRWHLQRDTIVIPKSINKDRIIENADVFNFNLSKEDIIKIDNLNRNMRTGSHPDSFTF